MSAMKPAPKNLNKMKALLLLFDKQDRIFFKFPLEAESMPDMLPALYLELFNNNQIDIQWKQAFYFHIVTVTEDAEQKAITSKSKLNFICNCQHYNLTPKETTVAWELRAGLTYKQISDVLDCSPNTVNTHINSIYDKLRVKNRHQAMLKLKADGQSV
jgi:DNA-binding CsgD family transcriptional regulator